MSARSSEKRDIPISERIGRDEDFCRGKEVEMAT